MTRTTMRLLLTVLALPLVAVACDDGDPIGSETAEVSLVLTDNPGDVENVWVDIGEVYLQGGGEQGRQTLLTADEADALGDDGLVELTELADATLELASDVTIDAGHYGQLRFVVEGAVLETEEGEVFTFNAEHPEDAASDGSMTCPSCGETGIKVVLSENVADLESGSHILVLDFDVSESFGREAGMSGMWVMNPVIRTVEIGFTGAISGTVDVERDENGDALVTIPECPAGTARDVDAFIPRAIAQNLTDDEGNAVRSTTEVNEDGSYTLGFLEPDTYDMDHAETVEFDGAQLVFEADAEPATADVTSGGDVQVDYTITSASCG